MKVLGVLCFGFFCFAFANGVATNKNVTKEKSSYIDLLIENVQKEYWEDNELHCYNRILNTLENARNFTLWAVWELDSIPFPNGFLYGSKYQLGNYDECLNAPWLVSHPEFTTKYCLADIKLGSGKLKKREHFDPYGSVEPYINTKTKHDRPLNTITWGVCVPSTCTHNAVSKLLKVLLETSVYGPVIQTANVSISVDDCQKAGEVPEYSRGFYIFWYLILFLLVLSVVSTLYLANNSTDPDSLVPKLARCFCMNKNTFDLVKPSAEDLPSMHGMRALTALIFVYTHQVFFLNSGAVGNGLNVDKDLDMGFFVLHTDLLTDTFLFMSGLLLVRGLYAKVKLENPVLVLWKRYVRLIGPMALIVFYMASVSIHMSDGPVWSRLAGHEQQTCSKNWWLSLLMLNNYINSQEMCYITLWYIPVDYQLTILGVTLVYLCRSHRAIGRLAVAGAALLAVLLPAYATYTYKLPATIIYNVETMIDIRQNVVFNSTYTRSHYRIGSYMVGLGMGYILSVYKPALYRNVISKKWSILAFTLIFAIAWVPMSLGGVFYTRVYSAVEAALYAATNRIVWVTAIGSLVLVCEYGDLPIVNRLLSWQAWVPLSRLSYGLYLTHPALIFYSVYSARAPLREHPFTMLLDSFGPMVMGYILSWLIWLLVQAPIIGLTNLTAQSKSKKQKIPSENVQAKQDMNGVNEQTKQDTNGVNGEAKQDINGEVSKIKTL